MRELIGMGARGVLLEDQVWPKRCGHMRGKEVVPAEEHVAKIRAAIKEAHVPSPLWKVRKRRGKKKRKKKKIN